jgi:hypothetical protein
MKKLLLTTALLAFAAPAYAQTAAAPAAAPAAGNPKCTTVQVPGQNLVQVQCESDNQVSDADDLKFFLDKQSGVQLLKGSLDKNTSIPGDQNILVTTNAGVSTVTQEGNGFAEMKSSDKGSPTNDLRAFTFFPIEPSIIDGQGPFEGFDGFYARGQVDATQASIGKNGKTIFTWDGDVFMHIVFTDNTTADLTFLGDTAKDDFGALGFDEPNEPGKLIKSVTLSLDNTGAFNELKQIEFSAVGALATPEPSTWAMLIAGFGLMGALGWKRKRIARYAV